MTEQLLLLLSPPLQKIYIFPCHRNRLTHAYIQSKKSKITSGRLTLNIHLKVFQGECSVQSLALYFWHTAMSMGQSVLSPHPLFGCNMCCGNEGQAGGFLGSLGALGKGPPPPKVEEFLKNAFIKDKIHHHHKNTHTPTPPAHTSTRTPHQILYINKHSTNTHKSNTAHMSHSLRHEMHPPPHTHAYKHADAQRRKHVHKHTQTHTHTVCLPVITGTLIQHSREKQIPQITPLRVYFYPHWLPNKSCAKALKNRVGLDGALSPPSDVMGQVFPFLHSASSGLKEGKMTGRKRSKYHGVGLAQGSSRP